MPAVLGLLLILLPEVSGNESSFVCDVGVLVIFFCFREWSINLNPLFVCVHGRGDCDGRVIAWVMMGVHSDGSACSIFNKLSYSLASFLSFQRQPCHAIHDTKWIN